MLLPYALLQNPRCNKTIKCCKTRQITVLNNTQVGQNINSCLNESRNSSPDKAVKYSIEVLRGNSHVSLALKAGKVKVIPAKIIM